MCIYRINKINLPNTEEEYVNGNGNKCYAKFNELESDIYESNAKAKGEVILETVTKAYPKLERGTVVPVEYRGENSIPVVPFEWLQQFR